MARLLLHCGLHKTGSTAFQNWLMRHAAELAARGLHVPVKLLPETGNGAAFALKVLTQPTAELVPTRARLRTAFLRFCAEAKGDVLLSAEDFETVFSLRIKEQEIAAQCGDVAGAIAALGPRTDPIRAAWRHLRAFATEAGLEEIQLAFVLRNHADRSASGFAQRVKQLTQKRPDFAMRDGRQGYAPFATCFHILEQEGARVALGCMGEDPAGIAGLVLGLLGLRERCVGLDLATHLVNASIGEVGIVVARDLRQRLVEAGLAEDPKFMSQVAKRVAAACAGIEDRPFHGFSAEGARRVAEGQARLDAKLSPWLSAGQIALLGQSRMTGAPSPMTRAEMTEAQAATARRMDAALAAALNDAGIALPFSLTTERAA